MAVLVTGGAGYIGSHTCVELLEAGYEVIVVDNLVNSSKEAIRRVEEITGEHAMFHNVNNNDSGLLAGHLRKPFSRLAFYEIDICRKTAFDALFDGLAKKPGIEAVVHFAALKAVGESVEKPLAYYANNLTGALNVLEAMQRNGVDKFVFSSSATVYGDPASVPVREDFPTSATNPYGATKLFIERILQDACTADPKLRVAILRYFNPIGAHPSGTIGEDPNGIPNNLIPYVAQVAVGKLEQVRVFGNDYPTPDGTGVRDYIHVVDLARGHVAALDKLAGITGPFVCNLGTGRGYSVLEVITAFEKACGRPIPYIFAPRRAGDVAAVYADPTRASQELGWQATYNLDDMCVDSWRWQKNNPHGYKK